MSDERFNIVVKHNDLVRNTVFSLNAMQQKILIYLISKISPYDDDLKIMQFHIKDFCKCIDINFDSGTNYAYIRDLIHDISTKNIKIETEDFYSNLRIIERYKIYINSGLVDIKLDDDLKPYLLNLKSNFTKYELYYILNFKSKYSIRLYELFKSYEFTRKLEIDIDKLQEKLQSDYDRFYDFKRKVIGMALEEINKETDLKVNVEYIKSGRSYKTIIFNINNWTKKPNQQIINELTQEPKQKTFEELKQELAQMKK